MVPVCSAITTCAIGIFTEFLYRIIPTGMAQDVYEHLHISRSLTGPYAIHGPVSASWMSVNLLPHSTHVLFVCKIDGPVQWEPGEAGGPVHPQLHPSPPASHRNKRSDTGWIRQWCESVYPPKWYHQGNTLSVLCYQNIAYSHWIWYSIIGVISLCASKLMWFTCWCLTVFWKYHVRICQLKKKYWHFLTRKCISHLFGCKLNLEDIWRYTLECVWNVWKWLINLGVF